MHSNSLFYSHSQSPPFVEEVFLIMRSVGPIRTIFASSISLILKRSSKLLCPVLKQVVNSLRVSYKYGFCNKKRTKHENIISGMTKSSQSEQLRQSWQPYRGIKSYRDKRSYSQNQYFFICRHSYFMSLPTLSPQHRHKFKK